MRPPREGRNGETGFANKLVSPKNVGQAKKKKQSKSSGRAKHQARDVGWGVRLEGSLPDPRVCPGAELDKGLPGGVLAPLASSAAACSSTSLVSKKQTKKKDKNTVSRKWILKGVGLSKKR